MASNFYKVSPRLGQRENFEKIMATCPELGKDPVACAFLTKPELLSSLLDQDTLKCVHKRHPGLWEAAYQLAAAVHEEENLIVKELSSNLRSFLKIVTICKALTYVINCSRNALFDAKKGRLNIG